MLKHEELLKNYENKNLVSSKSNVIAGFIKIYIESFI